MRYLSQLPVFLLERIPSEIPADLGSTLTLNNYLAISFRQANSLGYTYPKGYSAAETLSQPL